MNLVLHFDINGTIIPSDSTEVGTIEENANMVISKSVYGKIHDSWILNDDYRDQTDSISYYDYLKLVKEKLYKKKSFTFTEKNNPGESLQLMVKPVIEAMDSFFFKSFLKVLEAYPNAKIIFRTFGLDGDEVVQRLKIIDPERFNDVAIGKFSYDDGIPVLVGSDKKYRGMEEINQLIKSSTNLLFIENYEHWNSHDRAVEYGKQLLGDADMLQIFFDDNTCVNILDHLNAYYQQVNTLDALFNEFYLVDHIRSITKC